MAITPRARSAKVGTGFARIARNFNKAHDLLRKPVPTFRDHAPAGRPPNQSNDGRYWPGRSTQRYDAFSWAHDLGPKTGTHPRSSRGHAFRDDAPRGLQDAPAGALAISSSTLGNIR